MKDGRTHLAHKAEHAVDLETSAVVGVSVQDADAGDTQTMLETLVTAAEQVDAVQPRGPASRSCVRQGLPQQPGAGHVGRGGDPQLRVGAGSRAAQLARAPRDP